MDNKEIALELTKMINENININQEENYLNEKGIINTYKRVLEKVNNVQDIKINYELKLKQIKQKLEDELEYGRLSMNSITENRIKIYFIKELLGEE